MDLISSPPVLCANQNIDLEHFWHTLHSEAQSLADHEETLRPLVSEVILDREDFADCVAMRLSRKLAREDMPREQVFNILTEVIGENPEILQSMARDLNAIHERDPACHSTLEPFLFYKGFHAITNYRVSHLLWKQERTALALYFQSIGNEIFQVDIHPAAQIGCGIMLDHATSFVVGETGVIEDNVSILHEVTLGGTGKECGLRHPIVRSGVLIGAGVKILGRVEVGMNSKVGAGSVVLEDVPANVTVVGVPAKVVGGLTGARPALDMDQSLTCAQLSATSLDSAGL